MTRPCIGITGPDRGGYPAWFCASWAVRAMGGRPVRITPSRGLPRKRLHGLVIGGGADVEPTLYAPEAEPEEAPHLSEELHGKPAGSKLRTIAGYVLSPVLYVARRLFSAKRSGVDRGRDALETELLTRAEREGAAVLGICRGAQLMNVQRGGTLHRGLDSFYVESPNPWTMFPTKPVNIAPGSRLETLLGTGSCRVNSLHKQAVDRIGDRLVVTASEPNGVVQAVELPDHHFYVGVQWHPEYMPQRPEQRRLFRELVAAARALQRRGGGPVPVSASPLRLPWRKNTANG